MSNTEGKGASWEIMILFRGTRMRRIAHEKNMGVEPHYGESGCDDGVNLRIGQRCCVIH